MDKTKALQKLLNGTATKKEIEMLRQALANKEISIGGDVNRSVVIYGDNNKVELTAEALGILKPETKTEEPVAGKPPYMGLRYFGISDADLFYGREVLTRELLARVQDESFLAIVGASGSGKSSVARAGLVPAWKGENECGLVHILTPTAHPLESLAASLTRASESVTATSTLMDDLQKDSRSLRLYVKKMFSGKFLLLVDQFEETFTLCKDLDERKALIENLLSLAEEEGDPRVVLTLRADFYHHCAEYEGLRVILEKHQAYIGAMTEDELREAITQPAKANGWDFQPGLADLILQDVGTEPGALPLLSHALLETWKRRQGHTLTLQGYHQAGGVKKAITQTAEGVYLKLSPKEQSIARGIFLRLTELGEGTQDTRRRVKMDELGQVDEGESVSKVLRTLTDARLVTAEQDSAEVAHEALIREWGTLRKWLDEDRESLRLRRQLTESASEWERSGKDETFLVHRGGRLDDILILMQETSYTFTAKEQTYINICLQLKDRELQENERRQNERRQFEMLQVALEVIETVGNIMDLEKILDKALEKLHLLFENANVAFLLYNKNTDSLGFAPGTFKHYQVTNTSYENSETFKLDSKTIASRVAKRSILLRKQEVAFANDVENDPEHLNLNPASLSELCVSLNGNNGDLIGVIVVERDSSFGFDQNDIALVSVIARQLGLIFERAKLSEDLTYKSAVAAQTSWAASLAHDLNTEAFKIANWAYLIQQKEREGFEEIREYAKNIEESAYALSRFNPMTARRSIIFRVDEQLKQILEDLASKRSIRVDFHLNSSGKKIKVSPEQFRFIFKQLISNAARAMSDMDEKRILIETRLVDSQMVEILFQDFGHGISDEYRSTLFNKPITTKETGGFGLLLIGQMIEDMQGKITLMPAQPNKGACFAISLPIAVNDENS